MKHNKYLTLSAIALLAFLPSAAASGRGADVKFTRYSTNGGKYFTDYDTFDDAKAAANDLNLRMSEEGNSLLKNKDNALPMAAGTRISVFGVRQDNVEGGGGKQELAQVLQDTGFKVNPTLKRFYANDNSAIGSERTDFTGAVMSSLSLYNDAAVFIISRTGSEGADLATHTNEKVKDGDTHKNLLKDKDGKGFKHYLMLTDSEEALLALIEEHFSTVHIVVNTSNIIEVGSLKDDDKVKSILWIGRPGETGLTAVGEIYNGSVSPSGGVVDQWTRDHTADPTWQNFGDNSQNGTTNLYKYPDGTNAGSNSLPNTFPPMMPGWHGVDYEEGIYLGYRYYETYYAEYAKIHGNAAANEWYENAVAYPFGYGLNYSSFSFKAGKLYTNAARTVELGASVSGSKFESSVGHEAEVKKLYLPVTVRNTGTAAGKKVVQVYVTAPYTSGGIEKSFVTLAGFAKTGMIKPGAEQTVVVEFNVQDFASYDDKDKNANGNKGWELDAGEYTVRVMENAHYDLDTDITDETDAYDEVKFTMSTGANLKLDDFSGNEVGNLFSEENGMFYSERKGKNVGGASADMTLMTRANMDGSFPKAPTEADLTFTQKFFDDINKWECFDMDKAEYAAYDTEEMKAYAPWVDDINVPDTWTQEKDLGKYKITDISGIDPKSDAVVASGAFQGLTGKKAWETFMNSLSYEDMRKLPTNGGWSTVGIDDIGLKGSVDNDSPENFCSTHLWCDTPTISATFNPDLAYEEGVIVANLGLLKLGANLTGWYGPGMDTHRSPFSGRNHQYYSQDGLHAGFFSSAVVQGAESRGLVCYPKHFVCNDQETARDGELNASWINEQALREIYVRPFQMAMQEGDCSGTMTAFARIGDVASPDNYNLLTGLTRKEWGWDGYFVTDGYEGAMKSSPMDLMLRAGNDMALHNEPDEVTILDHYNADGTSVTHKEDRTVSGTWNSALRNGKGSLEVGTGDAKRQSDSQYYFVRTTAQRMLNRMANSVKTTNGVTLEKYAGKVVNGTQAALITGDVKADASLINNASMRYEIVDGVLPEGVTLNLDGTLGGTPSNYGKFEIKVRAIADNWQIGETKFTLDIAPAFTLDGATELTVGSAYSGYIDSDVITLDKGFASVEYGISGGELPAGLAMDKDGAITGTPTAAGTYEFVVDCSAGKPTGFGRFSRIEITHYYYTVTLTVKDTSKPAEDKPADDKPAEEKPTSTVTPSSSSTPAEDVKKGGCGGSVAIASSLIGAAGLAGVGLFLKKRKEEDK